MRSLALQVENSGHKGPAWRGCGCPSCREKALVTCRLPGTVSLEQGSVWSVPSLTSDLP